MYSLLTFYISQYLSIYDYGILLFLKGGDVFDKSMQPHESHIPFILQFLVSPISSALLNHDLSSHSFILSW